MNPISTNTAQFVQKEVFLIESYIQGLYNNPKRNKLLKRLHAHDELKLIREPDNLRDTNAIRIETCKSIKLGYMSMETTNIISRLMDAGKNITARIKSVDMPNQDQYIFNKYHIIRIAIFLNDNYFLEQSHVEYNSNK